jgi:hypothetical protein
MDEFTNLYINPWTPTTAKAVDITHSFIMEGHFKVTFHFSNTREQSFCYIIVKYHPKTLYQKLPSMQTYQVIRTTPKQRECKASKMQFFAPCLHPRIPTRENKTSCDGMRVELKNIKNSRQITTQYRWRKPPPNASEADFS